MNSLLLLLGRIFLSLPFLTIGFGQIVHFEDSCGIIRLLGFSYAPAICFLGIFLTLTGSFLLISGYKSRSGAVLLAAALIPATFLLHFSAEQKINLLRNLAILGGLMSFMAFGPGDWSLDGIRRGKKL